MSSCPIPTGARRTATINQIRALLIEQGIAVRAGARALRNSLFAILLFAILENRKDETSPRMAKLIHGLYEDWCCLDERIETVTGEIEELRRIEPKCQRLMSVPGIGPLISTALVAAIGTGEAFDRGRDLGAWLGLVPRQYSTGGRSILDFVNRLERFGQRQIGLRRLGTKSSQTRRWRETDSNPRSPLRENQLTRASRLTATGVTPGGPTPAPADRWR